VIVAVAVGVAVAVREGVVVDVSVGVGVVVAVTVAVGVSVGVGVAVGVAVVVEVVVAVGVVLGLGGGVGETMTRSPIRRETVGAPLSFAGGPPCATGVSANAVSAAIAIGKGCRGCRRRCMIIMVHPGAITLPVAPRRNV